MAKKRELTIKQEKFAYYYVKTGSKVKAYRLAYDPKDEGASWVYSKASNLTKQANIKARIDEIKQEISETCNITREKIVRFHLNMVEAWEELWELGKKKNLTDKETKRFYLLKEMVKGSDYRGSLDSISKMLGLNEPDKTEQIVTRVEIVEKKRDEE